LQDGAFTQVQMHVERRVEKNAPHNCRSMIHSRLSAVYGVLMYYLLCPLGEWYDNTTCGKAEAAPVFPRPVALLGIFYYYRRDVLGSPVARMDRGGKRGWGTPYHRLYGQMALGDFTHSNGEMALIVVMLDQGRCAVIELTNTLGNEHGGEIAITNFLNSGIEERVLGSQGSAS
jgi:hypothetical protein